MLTIRQDLDLIESAATREGKKVWLLQDSINNRFFKIGSDEVKMLALLKNIKIDFEKFEALCQYLLKGMGQHLTTQRVEEFLLFLKQNNLLTSNGVEGQAALLRQRNQLQPGLFKRALREYLFLKIHLLNPNEILDFVLPYLGFLFSRVFWVLIGGNAVVAFYLTSRQWDYFLSSFIGYMNINGLIIAGVSIAIVKILHEFGHAIVARYYGCSVNSMGIAFLIFWPVLFTDTTDAWRLKNKNQRALIGASGILVELVVASICLLLWNFTEEGLLKAAFFILATTTWIMTLVINLNPLMRFDGYFVLSDLLGVENLQNRSFDLAKWHLRERLFGYGANPPEKVRMDLILFAYATWIYRFFLFIAIALIIYNYFFKLLGLALVMLQLFRSLVKPLYSELKFWWEHRGGAKLFPNTIITFTLLGLVFLWLVVPTRQEISLPAFLQGADSESIFTKEAGRVVSFLSDDGAMVAEGELLIEMAYPDQAYQRRQLRHDIRLIEVQLAGQGVSARGGLPRAALTAQLRGAKEQLKELDKVLIERQIRAPFVGQVRSINPDLAIGEWLGKGEKLLTITRPDKQEVIAFISEQSIARIAPDSLGIFYSDGGTEPPVNVRLRRIDNFPVNELQDLYVASSYGGGLQIRDGVAGALIPSESSYRLYLTPETEKLPRILRGSVVIKTEPVSNLRLYVRTIVSLWRRESGF